MDSTEDTLISLEERNARDLMGRLQTGGKERKGITWDQGRVEGECRER